MSATNLSQAKIKRPNRAILPDRWTRLDRFLASGNETGIYSVQVRDWSPANLIAVRECLGENGLRTVRAVMAGMAGSDVIGRRHALHALALAASPAYADEQTNSEALQYVPQAVRTAAELRIFAGAAARTRGWGRSLRNAVAQWYLSRPIGELARELVLDQANEDWSHRDLIRMSHPKAEGATRHALFRWVVTGELDPALAFDAALSELRLIHAHGKLRRASSEEDIAHLIETYNVPATLVHGDWKHSERVWEALLDKMPYLEVAQNAGAMTASGLLGREGEATALVVSRLTDETRFARSGAHPLELLEAAVAYQSVTSWQPASAVAEALQEAYTLALADIKPAGKRLFVAIDASAGMRDAECLGIGGLSAADGAAALATLLSRYDPNGAFVAFGETVCDLEYSIPAGAQRIFKTIEPQSAAADGSLVIRDAMRRGLLVDAFVIVTGEGAWSGERHPARELQTYREKTGIAASLLVAAMSPSRFQIADLGDKLQTATEGLNASVAQFLLSAVA